MALADAMNEDRAQGFPWVRRLPILVLAPLLILASQAPWSAPVEDPEVINGPYALLLSSSTDLGPSHADRLRVTAALNAAEPEVLIEWAGNRGLTVRWRPGDAWAVVEGAPTDLSRAFDVAVHDYRGKQGQIFYASPRQPAVPAPVRAEVDAFGRILGYSPHHQAAPPIVPMDLPDFGLTPTMLLNAYNANPLSESGFTGKGQTIVVFAFDGYAQSDLDLFATTFNLPKFTPILVGDPPSAPQGEAAMDLQIVHAIAPDARIVLVNALPTVQGDATYEKIGQLFETVDQRFPGAVWSFSIGWGCDKLLTAADLAPVRSALATAQEHGTAAFDASGDLAGLDCRSGQDWSAPPGPDDIGLDAVASLPEMTSVGGTTLSTTASGSWVAAQAWFYPALTVGTGGGTSALFDRPPWQRNVLVNQHADHRLIPDVAAVADRFTGVKIVYNGAVMLGGGTSQSAPIWAGLAAVMDQYLIEHGGRPMGDLNPLLYRIAAGAARPAFRDVTLGGNAVYPAQPGYDLTTGLGVPDVENLTQNIRDLQTRPR
jgi:kumamolisin